MKSTDIKKNLQNFFSEKSKNWQGSKKMHTKLLMLVIMGRGHEEK